ncbi:MAG: aminoacyl-tRNA hydrolase [Lachnospiraceae bacterium]|nr:aminoacyl-tRNA hydrolase [Lachnospiraceae bacterium]
MYLIAGLGNPSDKYKDTRHNVGFDVIDALADRYGIKLNRKRGRAVCGRGEIEGESVLLAKPQTYMNLSGDSISRLVRSNGLDPKKDLIVVLDDIHLDPGNIRIRQQGSAGGHNGMKDIIAKVHTDEILRVRIGVGEVPEGGDQVKHVLSRFSAGERLRVNEAIADAEAALALMVQGKTDEAMNRYNQKKY